MFSFLVTAGALVVGLGLALLGFQFLCMVIALAAAAIWGIIGTVVKFFTTKP